MARTIGAATNNRYNWVSVAAVGGNLNATLFAGWFLPTTLTAGRGYWSAGATTGLEVGTTTSEVIGRSQATTANSVYISSGAGIVTGQWTFIAHYIDSTNTGPNADQWLWIGDIQKPPAEVTFTQTTAPTGTFTSQTTIVIGNKGAAGTVAFQGDVGNCFCAIQSTSVGGPFNLSGYGPAGKTATDFANERDFLLKSFVLPWWSGEAFPARGLDYSFSGTTPDRFVMFALPFDSGGATTQTNGLAFQSGVGTSPFALSVSGTTVSQNRTPRGGLLESILPPIITRV